MNKFQKIIARAFRIKTQKTVLTVCDEISIISDFMKSKPGTHLCDYLNSQKFAVAGRSANFMRNGDFWQGYSVGFAAAIDSILSLRQSDVNDNPGNSSEVGLDELALKLDQSER